MNKIDIISLIHEKYSWLVCILLRHQGFYGLRPPYALCLWHPCLISNRILRLDWLFTNSRKKSAQIIHERIWTSKGWPKRSSRKWNTWMYFIKRATLRQLSFLSNWSAGPMLPALLFLLTSMLIACASWQTQVLKTWIAWSFDLRS